MLPLQSPGQRERGTLKDIAGDNKSKGKEEVRLEVAGLELRSWDWGVSMWNSLISTESLFCFVLAVQRSLRGLSSPTRDRTWAHGSESTEP